jgi:hypothetical protein
LLVSRTIGHQDMLTLLGEYAFVNMAFYRACFPILEWEENTMEAVSKMFKLDNEDLDKIGIEPMQV